MDNPEKFKKIHAGTLSQLLIIYWQNKPILKSWFFRLSVLLSFIVLGLVTRMPNVNAANTITTLLCEIILEIMPDILGFNLGGYVLLISLNSEKILDEITDPVPGEKYSVFQTTSSVFAFSILLQAFSIVLSFLFVLCVALLPILKSDQQVIVLVNFIVLLFISVVSFYSVLIICQIVLNIFNFGQTLHFFTRLPKFFDRDSKKDGHQ